MGGEWVVTKPSRSDEVIGADQQLEIANQIRAHFDSMAPKRPIKPNRSEADPVSATATPAQMSYFEGENIPEFHKFLSLQSQSHPICSGGGASSVKEEFVETQYYKELNSIDKQHHTTGSGFISVVEGCGDKYGFELQGGHGRRTREMSFRSNPATNDWIPSVEGEEMAIFITSKPSRSESFLDG